MYSNAPRRLFTVLQRYAICFGLTLGLCGTALAQLPATPVAQRPAVVALAEEFNRDGGGVIYVEKKKGAVLFLGTRHTYNPEDPQIESIENFVKDYKPTIIVLEGGNWPIAANKEQAVRRHSEFGFTQFLASKANIKTRTFEPPEEDELAEVLKQFTATDAKLYYALRMVPVYVGAESDIPIEQRMNAFLSAEKSGANFGKKFPANTSPRNVEELTQLCAEKFPELKDWRKIDFSYSQVGRKKTVFRDVEKLSKIIRDREIEKAIYTEVAKGERIMILAGINHMGSTVSNILKTLAFME